MLNRIAKWWCKTRGYHKWLGVEQSEFVLTLDICSTCLEKKILIPWGMCLDGTHPISDHYTLDGLVVRTTDCLGPK